MFWRAKLDFSDAKRIYIYRTFRKSRSLGGQVKYYSCWFSGNLTIGVVAWMEFSGPSRQPP